MGRLAVEELRAEGGAELVGVLALVLEGTPTRVLEEEEAWLGSDVWWFLSRFVLRPKVLKRALMESMSGRERERTRKREGQREETKKEVKSISQSALGRGSLAGQRGEEDKERNRGRDRELGLSWSIEPREREWNAPRTWFPRLLPPNFLASLVCLSVSVCLSRTGIASHAP
jgi:hypothetical protein